MPVGSYILLLGDAPKSNELSEALVNIILGKKKNFERVNIAERLQEIGLLEHFPDELWAQTSAVCMLLDAYLGFMVACSFAAGP